MHSPTLVTAAAVVTVSLAIPGHLHSQDYSQWRGQSRDGAASGFIEPSQWPETLNQRWRVTVGEGYATPLVVGETVYVFTRREQSEVMTALDAETGAQRWQSRYPARYTPSKPTEPHGSGPKATPLFHNGKLFTLGISGIVSAFDAATGKLLWQTAEPSEHPFFSAAASPVGDGDAVIVHPGNYGPLTAFATTSGDIRWVAGGGGFFMSPLIVELGGIKQVVSFTQAGVIGVSVADGRVLWEYPWAGGKTGGTMPVMYDGTVIVGAANGVTAFRPSRTDAGWTTETVWETQDVSMYLSNPVVIDDTLYGLSRRASGQYFALDTRDGKVLWLGQPREAENTAVVKAGKLLFLLNDDAELIVARASRTGFEPLRRYTVSDSATWAQPAISGNRIFVKDVGTLTLWTVN